MPTSTVAYPFEGKVLQFAAELAAKLLGRETSDGFMMTLDENGSVEKFEFRMPAGGWHAIKDKLLASKHSFLFFDPFDAPIYTWIEWQEIDQATMERLLEVKFSAADFQSIRPAGSKVPALSVPDSFPSTWSVMF